MRILLLLVLGWWTYKLAFTNPPHIFLDYMNLAIHEAGHVLLLFAGETVRVLGGTILQLLVPLIFLIYFSLRKDFLALAFCLFWLGDNFVNISVYIRDAYTQALPLIGAGNHDWNFLLGKWGQLQNAEIIGRGVSIVGFVFIFASLILTACLVLGIIKSRPSPQKYGW